MPQLRAFSKNHPVFQRPEEALPYLTPYAALEPPSDQIEVTPTVDGSSIWLALANTSELKRYDGAMTINLAAMHLGPKDYDAVDARSHAKIALNRVGAKELLKIALKPAELQVLELKPSPRKEQ